MKRYGFALLAVLLFAVPARAQKGIDLGHAVATQYIWRGFDLSPAKAPAWQPTATFAFGDFSVNFWGSVLMSERSNGGRELDEFDLTLGYSRTVVDGFNMDFGLIYYTFPQLQNGGNESLEWFMGFSTDKVSFEPAITFYYDTKLANGLYVLISGSQPLVTAPSFPLNLDVSMGNGYSYFTDGGALHDINFGLSTGWGNKYVSFSPSIVYTITPGDKVNSNSGQLWGLFSLDLSL